MGFTLPSPTSPAEHVRTLMTRKDAVEAELQTHAAILTANANTTLNSPLVDRDGFPRDDIDIYAVRNARVRIIELRNDLKGLMDEIGKALEGVYDPNVVMTQDAASKSTTTSKVPFLKVQGVSPNSPAADAGLQRGDLILQLGNHMREYFSVPSKLVELVGAYENRPLPLEVLRDEQTVHLRLTPQKGWGGPGMLGCHVVPYSPE